MKSNTKFKRSRKPVPKEDLEVIVSKANKVITNKLISIFEWTPIEDNDEIYLGPEKNDPSKYSFEYLSTTVKHEGKKYHLHPRLVKQIK